MTKPHHLVYLAAAIVGAPTAAQTLPGFSELMSTVSSNPPTQLDDLLGGTKLCEAILDSTHPEQSQPEGWNRMVEGQDGFARSRSGMVLMFVREDGNFPKSCGIVAIPAQSPDEVIGAFKKCYGRPTALVVTPPNARFVTTLLASDKFTYRLRDAKNPENAIGITVRNKED